MSPWRLELLRLWRTGRLVALVATFLIVGLGIPVLTYFLPQLVESSASGVEITVPKQTAADGIVSYGSNIGQIGTLVVAIVAAASIAIDARPGLSAFYRTRVRSPLRLILPRWVATIVATLVALALGTLGAWYETAVLLGHVDPGDLMVGIVLEALWFIFVICVVVGFAGALRGVLGIVGSAIGFLLAVALLGTVSAMAAWLPRRLSSSVAALFEPDPADDLWKAVLVTVFASIAAFGLGVWGIGRREV